MQWIEAFKRLTTVEGRVAFLEQDSFLVSFLSEHQHISSFLKELSLEQRLIALEMFFLKEITETTPKEQILNWISCLVDAERFYWELGGLLGYQALIVEKLVLQPVKNKTPVNHDPAVIYHRPCGLNLFEEGSLTFQAIVEGLKTCPSVCVIYPVGGAADRLQFTDPVTQIPLPAALLPFLGKTLLEGLIRDVQALEFLYYKVFGSQIDIPIALMTSGERSNHRVLFKLCQEAHFFGKNPAHWIFFKQPQVPMVDRKGKWCVGRKRDLLQRPGGHGALWKAAKDQGVFEKLLGWGKKKVLIRQINNPIAGIDFSLLAFMGLGFQKEASFGFLSCQRDPDAAEGVNVLIERKTEKERFFCLSNVEYCDLKNHGIADSLALSLPANTNILFGDLLHLQEVVSFHPFPGPILNFKELAYLNSEGKVVYQEMARLETLMQNIADAFQYKVSEEEVFHPEHMPTFIAYQERRKTISTTKRGFQIGKSLLETPQGSYRDYCFNGYQLLTECGFVLPPFQEPYPLHFVYHPALGPLYSLITQKLVGGQMALGSEWQLEIADLYVENIHLQGSFLIRAHQVMGHFDEEGVLHYSERTGRCFLKNVTVSNQGIDRSSHQTFWKNEIVRQEACEILLEGDSELIGENLVLEGNLQIFVPDGQRARLFMEGGRLNILYEKMEEPELQWAYVLGEKRIEIKKAAVKTAALKT